MSSESIGDSLEAKRNAFFEGLNRLSIEGDHVAAEQLSKYALGGYKKAQDLIRQQEHASTENVEGV